MKDEIKDLKCLGALGNLQSFAIDGTKGSKIVDINVNIVKNYITNLQKRCEYLERSNNRREDEIMSLRDECVDGETYKSRNEKAISILKDLKYIDKYKFTWDREFNKALNILNGGDE